jgi:hypothetical protein
VLSDRLCSVAQPPGRLGIIPLYTPTSGIQLPEIKLGKGITLTGEVAISHAPMAATASLSGAAIALAAKHNTSKMAPNIDLNAHIISGSTGFGGYGQTITLLSPW